MASEFGEDTAKMETTRVLSNRCRWSAKTKRDAVLRLLHRQSIDKVSRELKVTAAG